MASSAPQRACPSVDPRDGSVTFNYFLDQLPAGKASPHVRAFLDFRRKAGDWPGFGSAYKRFRSELASRGVAGGSIMLGFEEAYRQYTESKRAEERCPVRQKRA